MATELLSKFPEITQLISQMGWDSNPGRFQNLSIKHCTFTHRMLLYPTGRECTNESPDHKAHIKVKTHL